MNKTNVENNNNKLSYKKRKIEDNDNKLENKDIIIEQYLYGIHLLRGEDKKKVCNFISLLLDKKENREINENDFKNAIDNLYKELMEQGFL